MTRLRPCLLLLAAVLAAAAPVSAKVLFTGYADFRLSPQTAYRLFVPAGLYPASVIAPGSSWLESRGATLDAVGLFATSALSDQASFACDLTWRDIGYATRALRIQYAYVEDHLTETLMLRAGKIPVPFGYLNQYQFYPFQRPSITPPTFVSSILGLPIADLGASLRWTKTTGPVVTRLTAYGVNGYGPVPGTRTSFRSASLPGGLTIANNLASTNPDKKFSAGGRAAVELADHPGSETGVSYHTGSWSADGKRMMALANAHLRAAVGPVTVLGEVLQMDVDRDDGMRVSFGTEDWRTQGYFTTAELAGLTAGGKALTPWARFEDYRSVGLGAGRTAAEHLRAWGGGAAWQMADGLVLKLEVSRLEYSLPMAPGAVLGLAGNSYLLGLAASF